MQLSFFINSSDCDFIVPAKSCEEDAVCNILRYFLKNYRSLTCNRPYVDALAAACFLLGIVLIPINALVVVLGMRVNLAKRLYVCYFHCNISNDVKVNYNRGLYNKVGLWLCFKLLFSLFYLTSTEKEKYPQNGNQSPFLSHD